MVTSSQDMGKFLKDKNFELERYNSEMEVRLDSQDRDLQRLRAECLRLETELRQERDRSSSGMSQDQLSRMQQVNKFLEHNLKENGEMLSSLAKLYEEGREMKKRNLELEDLMARCVCSRASHHQDSRSHQARYLRAESFRKALIWQKRYLLVLISGDISPDPVFVVERDYRLDRLGRFRALVHGVIAVVRMRFLVKRWRTGKRAGAYTTPTPTTPVLPSLDFSPSPSPTLSRVGKTQSLSNYPLTANNRLPPVSPRNPPTFARSNSFKSPFPRDTASQASSSTSSSRPPAFTGQTPPTREVKVRRSASLSVRRSLDTNLGAVADQQLQTDLEEYFRRFGSLQR